MGVHTATTYVDYQQRASEFSVGDLAFPLAGGATDESQAGTVVAVFPGIGQVDIEFPWGSGRYPVEDVQRVKPLAIPPDPEHNSVPGGAGTVSVPGGPVSKSAARLSIDRISQAWVKSALYWASKDRTYRGTKIELDGGKYACPKCKAGEDGNPIHLRPANYKRVDGQSHRLLGCPHCLFLIKRDQIIGDPSYQAPEVDAPVDDVMADWDGGMNQGFESVRSVKSAKGWDDDSLLRMIFPKSAAGKAEVMVKFDLAGWSRDRHPMTDVESWDHEADVLARTFKSHLSGWLASAFDSAKHRGRGRFEVWFEVPENKIDDVEEYLERDLNKLRGDYLIYLVFGDLDFGRMPEMTLEIG